MASACQSSRSACADESQYDQGFCLLCPALGPNNFFVGSCLNLRKRQCRKEAGAYYLKSALGLCLHTTASFQVAVSPEWHLHSNSSNLPLSELLVTHNPTLSLCAAPALSCSLAYA